MDFRELSYVIAIEKHGSISKAAQELYITQPTLSKFLQNIEQHLGQPLFQRMGNRFLPTYAGKRYIERAREILVIKKQLDQELSDIIRESVGELKIGFPITRGTYMLPATLPTFRSRFPQVRIQVMEANSGVLEEKLISGDIDIAFFNMPIIRSLIEYEVLSKEEIVLIMSSEHPLAGLGVWKQGCKYPWMDLARVKEEPFVLQESDQRTRQIAVQVFKEADMNPNIDLTMRNILASIQLAASGFWVSLVNETHLKYTGSNVKPACFSIGNPNTTNDFVAAYRRGIYLPNYAKEYISIVKNAI